MKDYIISVGTVMMLIAFSHMILPEGGLKRFATLATGFMIICAVLSPLKGGEAFDFSGITVENAAPFSAADDAQYRAEVLRRHRENLEKQIENHMQSGKAYVEVDNDGNLTQVTLRSDCDESKAVLYITLQLGLSRERIVVTDEDI